MQFSCSSVWTWCNVRFLCTSSKEYLSLSTDSPPHTAGSQQKELPAQCFLTPTNICQDSTVTQKWKLFKWHPYLSTLKNPQRVLRWVYLNNEADLLLSLHFFVFTASLSHNQKGKVAEERGLMVWGSLIQLLIWKIQLSCVENNKVWHRRIFLCNQGIRYTQSILI